MYDQLCGNRTTQDSRGGTDSSAQQYLRIEHADPTSIRLPSPSRPPISEAVEKIPNALFQKALAAFGLYRSKFYTKGNFLPWERSSVEDSVDTAVDFPFTQELSNDLLISIFTGNEKTLQDQKNMLHQYLQSLIFPERLLYMLRGASKNEAQRANVDNFEKRLEEATTEFLQHVPTHFVTTAGNAFAIAVLGKTPGLESLAALLGLTNSQLRATSSSAEYDIFNRIRRYKPELVVILETFLKQQKHHLAEQGLSQEFANFAANAIMDGAFASYEDMQKWLNLLATFAGYAAGVLVSSLNVSRIPAILTDVLFFSTATTITGLWYRKKMKEQFGQEYHQMQAALDLEAQNMLRRLGVQQGLGIGVNIQEDSQLNTLREQLVTFIREHSNTPSSRVSYGVPWLIPTGKSLLEKIIPGLGGIPLSGLVDSALIFSAFEPWGSQATRDGQKLLAKSYLQQLHRIFLDVFHSGGWFESEGSRDFAQRDALRNYGLQPIDRAKPLNLKGSLVLHTMDTTLHERRMFTGEFLSFPAGKISLIRGESGTGKTTFAKLLLTEIGDLADMSVASAISAFGSNHIYLCQLTSEEIAKHTAFVDAQVSDQRYSTLEQVALLIRDSSAEINPYLAAIHASSTGSKPTRWSQTEREAFSNVLLKPNKTDKKQQQVREQLLSTLRTHLAETVGLTFLTNQELEDFLMRKPGQQGGTSAGEATRLEIWKALLLDKKILVLDEPTANLDVVTAERLVNGLGTYLRHNPQTVVLCLVNQESAREAIRNGEYCGTQVVGTVLPDEEYTMRGKKITTVLWMNEEDPSSNT